VDHLAIAAGLERLISLIRALSPNNDLSLTTGSTVHRLATNGPQRLSDLAASEGVTQPAMTQLVSRLERQGFAERRGEPSDRRVVMVHLTETGRQMLRDRQTHRAARLAQLLSALPALARLTDLVSGPSPFNGATTEPPRSR
jgi:DNA-binding MarR family transcriptional regulator